ncbi:hypothetical protein Noda2021_00760 [Candidatus Dependentiae bacterium Noda2021]|nr:hypothetical protein Noda2021_00760 [Candidatus Dependentiae bacterium Noda2021]
MNVFYFLLLLTSYFIHAQEKQVWCTLDRIDLGAEEIQEMNTLFAKVLNPANQWPNQELKLAIGTTHNLITILPTKHASLFTKYVTDNASRILHKICKTHEFENSYYDALTNHTDQQWQEFQAVFCKTTMNALSNKLPICQVATPEGFLTTHLADEQLKKKSQTWVLPGLLVMMYGKKIQRLCQKK